MNTDKAIDSEQSNTMDSLTANDLIPTLTRYKLPHRILEVDDIEIGGGNNIKLYKRYYLYIPLLIGSIIIILGFLMNFILLEFCALPFFLYTLYGIREIYNAIRENKNAIIIYNDEISIGVNNVIKKLNSNNTKDYEIKIESLNDEFSIGKLFMINIENKEYLILTLVDDELEELKASLELIKNFIQVKLNRNEK